MAPIVVSLASRHEHRMIEAGHNLPQEAPEAFADAVLTLRQWLRAG
jgi:pimeloyl-ACP methyl ester carboxylesterase